MFHQQPVQHVQNVSCIHSGSHRHAKRFTGVFIKHSQHFVGATIAELVMYKIDRPDVVRMGRPEPDDRAVFMIKPPSLFVPMGQLQSFFAP